MSGLQEINSLPSSSSESGDDEQLIFDREQLTDVVFICKLHSERIKELEKKTTTLSFLFLLFVVTFAAFAFVVLSKNN